MADTKVSDMTSASTPDGTELAYVVQSGDKKITLSAIINWFLSLSNTFTNLTLFPSIGLGTSGNAILTGDGANIVSQRNGVTSQAKKVYNTFTDLANYERFVIDWQTTANTATIGTQAGGTGTLRGVSAVGPWTFTSPISASVGTSSINQVQLGSGANIGILWSGKSRIGSPADGMVQFNNNAQTARSNLDAGYIKYTVFTVSTLPAAATAGSGARSFVSDALAPAFGSTVVTGGAVTVPVYSDGTNWKVG